MFAATLLGGNQRGSRAVGHRFPRGFVAVKVSQTALMLPAETPLSHANKTAGAGCACVHVEQMLRL